MRTYAGLFEEEVRIDEFLIAKKNGITKKQVVSNLEYLQKDGIIQYNAVKSNVELLFLSPREDDYTINKFSKEIKQYIDQKQKKSNDLIRFVNNDKICRSIQILNYFDDLNTQKCGICDVCISENRKSNENLSNQIIGLLEMKEQLSSSEIIGYMKNNEADILNHLRLLLAENKIRINHQNKYQLNL